MNKIPMNFFKCGKNVVAKSFQNKKISTIKTNFLPKNFLKCSETNIFNFTKNLRF